MSQLWATAGASGTGSYRTYLGITGLPSTPPAITTNLFYTGTAPSAPAGSNLPASRAIAYGSFNGGLNAGPKASTSLLAFPARIGARPAMVARLQLTAGSGAWPYGNENRGNLP